MKLNCKRCEKEFDLRNAEYNRQIKKGRPVDKFYFGVCNNGNTY